MDKEFEKLLLKAKEIEKEYGSLKNFALQETYNTKTHRLRIRKKVNLEKVYEGLKDLEFADLVDFQNLKGEYGERF